jgi:hypothetical protein
MRKPLVAIVIVALGAIGFAGCGSSETKTVTETVEGAAKAPEASSTETEEAAEGDTPTATTIPDGTWQRGADYQPGQYRAPGGATCSWEQNEKLGGEAGGEGFNENYGIGEKNPFIEIDSPYFKTEECGTWVKVGG